MFYVLIFKINTHNVFISITIKETEMWLSTYSLKKHSSSRSLTSMKICYTWLHFVRRVAYHNVLPKWRVYRDTRIKEYHTHIMLHVLLGICWSRRARALGVWRNIAHLSHTHIMRIFPLALFCAFGKICIISFVYTEIKVCDVLPHIRGLHFCVYYHSRL